MDKYMVTVTFDDGEGGMFYIRACNLQDATEKAVDKIGENMSMLKAIRIIRLA
jgi:hypothetical protein